MVKIFPIPSSIQVPFILHTIIQELSPIDPPPKSIDCPGTPLLPSLFCLFYCSPSVQLSFSLAALLFWILILLPLLSLLFWVLIFISLLDLFFFLGIATRVLAIGIGEREREREMKTFSADYIRPVRNWEFYLLRFSSVLFVLLMHDRYVKIRSTRKFMRLLDVIQLINQ